MTKKKALELMPTVAVTPENEELLNEMAAAFYAEFTCGLCSGELVYMGNLGRLEWHRCRNCGMDWCSKGAYPLWSRKDVCEEDNEI